MRRKESREQVRCHMMPPCEAIRFKPAVPLLEIADLQVSYGGVTVLDGIDLAVGCGEVVGIVGESGSGKSTLISAILGVLRNGASIDAGKVVYDDVDLIQLDEECMSAYRGSQISMVCQNPMSTFSPVRTLRAQFVEAMQSCSDISRSEAVKRAAGLLESLGVRNVDRVLAGYSFELSGGMCQRAALAIVMSMSPQLLLADEPTSALDVTMQAQVVKEMMKLRQDFGTAIIMVTHNMGVAYYMADTIAVLYAGRIVELGSSMQIRSRPHHPYTRALIKAIPQFGTKAIQGIATDLQKTESSQTGCCFASRCSWCDDACSSQPIKLIEVEKGHFSECVHAYIDGRPAV